MIRHPIRKLLGVLTALIVLVYFALLFARDDGPLLINDGVMDTSMKGTVAILGATGF